MAVCFRHKAGSATLAMSLSVGCCRGMGAGGRGGEYEW